ncbi:hypothetical protein ACHAWF_017274 [Thalassiosira exigua]
MRSALFTSWTDKGKKQFLDEHDNRIGKAIIAECFQRDRIREINNQAPLSEVRESTVNLNKWSKMNAFEAKRPFSLKTLCEIASHLYTEMNVTVEDRLLKEKNGPLGYFPTVAMHMWTKWNCMPEHQARLLAPKISSFEWLANVHEIFNATLMNTDLHLSWDNITWYENQTKKCLNYFQRLRKKQLQRKSDDVESWEKSFLAPETWRNLRITCRGFFAYARYLIQHADYAETDSVPKFRAVNPAHSNTSVLEAWFATVRNHRQDSPSGYNSIITGRDLIKSNDAKVALDKNINKAYLASDVGDVAEWKVLGPDAFIKDNKRREKRMTELINQFDTYKSEAPMEAYTCIARNNLPTNLKHHEREAMLRLASRQLPKGYLGELLDQEYFRQWMQLSFDTPTESWFSHLMVDTIEKKYLSQFESACREIQERLFDMAMKSLLNRWLREALHDSLRMRHPKLFKANATGTLSAAEENSEVNRFLGWAIFSAMKKFPRDEPHRLIMLAIMMRERDIDEEYLEKYYDINMALLNCGGLTLANKSFFTNGERH